MQKWTKELGEKTESGGQKEDLAFEESDKLSLEVGNVRGEG